MNVYSRDSDRSQRSQIFPAPRRQFSIRPALALTCAILGTLGLGFVTAVRLTPRAHAFSKQSRAAGAAVFHDRGCEHCHGIDGIGTDRGPELLTIGKRWHKDRIEQQIRNGGGGMPPFGGILQADEVKVLVDYLSSKRKLPKRPVQP